MTTVRLILTYWACAGDAPPPAPPVFDVVVEDPSAGLCVATLLDRWDEAHLAAQVDALVALGAREVRQEIRWDEVEPARDTWDWSRHDGWVGAVEAAGLDAVVLLAYGNTWASGEPDPYYPPDDPADFASFAAAAVARYPHLRRWEIWNEPNSGFRFWKVGDPPALSGDPAGYAALFVAAADAIHAVDPDAEVAIGGTFFHEQGIVGAISFLTDAIAAEPRFLEVADGVAIHPYTLYPPRVGPETEGDGELALWTMLAQLRELTGELPVSITEVGWPSFDTVSEDEQGAWLPREYALAHAGGVRDVCWYTLEDHDTPPSDPEEAFGLTEDGPGAWKPSGEAFAAFAGAIAGKDAYGRIDDALGLPEGVYAVRYGEDDLAWTTGEGIEACGATLGPEPAWVRCE